MPRIYDEDVLDLGSPLRFAVSGLMLEEGEPTEDLSDYEYKVVVKDAIDSASSIASFTSGSKGDAFDHVSANKLLIQVLDATESAALESAITPPEKEKEINSKKLIGSVYVTVSLSGNGVGPENIIHIRADVLKPAL